MPLRLLLDQGLPAEAALLLRDNGIDCLHVAEVGMWAAEDPEILEFAKGQNRIVVTLDADFHAIMMLGNFSMPSVIRVRIEGLSGVPCSELLRRVVEIFREELQTGCLITVKERKMTCHLLKGDWGAEG